MKHVISLLLILLTYFPAVSQTKSFDFTANIDSLYSVHPNGFAIYLSAFWCGPCIGKSKPIYHYFKSQKDSIPLIFVYDDAKFTKEKGENLLGDCFTKSSNYVIGRKNYTAKGFIQINPQKKAIKNIIAELKKYPIKKGILDNLYVGKLLYFNSSKELCIIEYEYGKTITNKDIESFIYN